MGTELKKDFLGIAGFVLTGAILLSFSGVAYSFARGIGKSVAAAPAMSAPAEPEAVLVIDPGHGGEDGGAVAADGTEEKTVDLAIARDIDALCVLFGIPSVMTRTDDRMLYDKYPGYDPDHKKAADLRARLRTADEASASLLLSVHANKFPSPSVRGLQVFYSPNGEDSRRAAGIAQEYLNRCLQPDHVKEIKKADASIYLLHRAGVPAILAECGFLSNEEELSKLKTEEYRADVACVLLAAAAEYLSAGK